MQENKGGCKYCGQTIYWSIVDSKWVAFSDENFTKRHKPTCNNYGVAHRFKEGDVILFTLPSNLSKRDLEDVNKLYKIKDIVADYGGILKYIVITHSKYGWWDRKDGNNKAITCSFVDKNSKKIDEETGVALYG